ncbi:FecR family protein [Olivibacter sitiensis]|uniref:FecR family protein n=1 Tax=Olivibacter sitiensis TaxID=376470 RepID=UPI000425864D|nr:FecR family protein [Olivibacter sitiensis]
MSRKAFRDLLERYLKGKCSPKEQKIVRQWYDLLDTDRDFELGDADFDEIEARLWSQISQKTTTINQVNNTEARDNGHKSLSVKKPLLAIAVCMVLLIMVSWWINNGKSSAMGEPSFLTSASSKVIVVSNEHDRPKLIILPDSSTIELYKGSEVKYAKRFDENRKILLKGDALFDVKKNAHSPFVVYREGTITKVLGTRFLIKGDGEQGSSEVIVYDGKVEVMENNEKRNLIARMMTKPARVSLSVNQRAIVQKDKHTICETIVEHPMPLETKQNLLKAGSFDEMPLDKLTEKLSDIYGIGIKAEPNVGHLTFTGNLDNLELFSLLEMICCVTATKYEIKGKEIFIQ